MRKYTLSIHLPARSYRKRRFGAFDPLLMMRCLHLSVLCFHKGPHPLHEDIC